MSLLESNLIQSVIRIPVIARTRRNHGLEHATLHLLAKNFPGTTMGGHSDAGGFWIIGDIPTETLKETIQEALQRLSRGERQLAIHPNCGTNFVAAGTMAGLGGALGMLGAGGNWKNRLERLSLSIMLATLALIFAQPLGHDLQKHITTSGDPGDLSVVKITPLQRGKMRAHRIMTQS